MLCMQISGLFPLWHSCFVKDNCRLIIKHSQGELCQLYCKLVRSFRKSSFSQSKIALKIMPFHAMIRSLSFSSRQHRTKTA